MAAAVAVRETTAHRVALKAIVLTGLIAGTTDIAQAIIQFGLRVPYGVAAGLLGRQAVAQGGAALYTLGLALHYGIATTWTAIYYAASRKLPFLIEHPLVCGLFFGLAVECVMNLVVLPLSALHAAGPYTQYALLDGMITHMITIGLPVAYGLRYFTK